MEDERLKKAIELAQAASAKDREGSYEEALELYKTSLDHWQLVCKYQTNDILKQRLYKKMEEYITRAEQLKTYLKNNVKPTAPLPAPAGGGQGGDGTAENGGEKDEKEKMKEALSGAIVTEKPNVSWDEVAGLEGAKEALQEAVILPTRFPQLFTGNRKPWKGILLYGPPGTGKSYLAKACATEASAKFFSVSSSDLVSKWQGESERLVRTLFEMARSSGKAIIFIDEVDSLCGSRGSDGESESSRRIKTEFLVQMQGVGNDTNGVLVLGATNTPWELDTAIRRRFERRIYIPLPDVRAREKIFQLNVGGTPNSLGPADFKKMAEKTEGFSGADISIVVRDALFEPVRRCRAATHFKRVRKDGKDGWEPCSPGDKDPTKKEQGLMDIPPEELMPPDLSMWDFDAVLDNARATVGTQDLVKQMEFTEQFGSEGS